MKRLAATLWSLVLLLGACQPATDPATSTPPLAYALPDTAGMPHLFAPNVVSSALPEFATTFSPDGATVYFNRANPARDTLQLLQSTFRDGRWSPPEPLPFSDGTYSDIDPFVSLDGQRLYFSSTRPVDGTEPKDYDIWYLERTETGWSDPINPGAPLNTDDAEVFVTASRNGTLYFTVFQDTSRAIFRAAQQNGAFQPPERLRFDVGDDVRLSNPVVAPDESYLLVVSGELDSMGGGDIFIARPTPGGIWSRPENLGPAVNTEHVEFAPALTPDGGYLFFTSERPGIVPAGTVDGRAPGDLYQVRWPLP